MAIAALSLLTLTIMTAIFVFVYRYRFRRTLSRERLIGLDYLGRENVIFEHAF